MTHDQLLEDWSNPFADPIWTLFGDAIARKAPIDLSQSTEDGLVLGIKSPVRGNWVGYFAMSRDDNATLYHVVMTVPNKKLPVWSFSTGMYIQTNTRVGEINYVACTGEATPIGLIWKIESGVGNSTDVTHHYNLWNSTEQEMQQQSTAQDMQQSTDEKQQSTDEQTIAETSTKDCTIITNGSNFLQAYLDGNMVYSSDKLNLQMPKPFNSYLEVQTAMDDMLDGKFRDYYSTRDESIKVINAPVGGVVKMIESSSPSLPSSSPSKILALATVNENGVAKLDIGRCHFPLKDAQIQVYILGDILYASTAPNTSFYGGDVYSLPKL
jgi:hypothetical protein